MINFHGIGEPWEGVPDDEQQYWCPTAEWPGFADALAELSEQATVKLEITFDDGNLSDLEQGCAALTERGLAATFHICAGRIGRPHYLADNQIGELQEAGMSIGSHGWNHVDLRTLMPAALDQEVRDSQARISEASGVAVTQFALPFGSYDRGVLASLRGYRRVYTSDRMRAPLSSWLTPRMSYIRGWRPPDLIRFATEHRSWRDRAERHAISAWKRLR